MLTFALAVFLLVITPGPGVLLLAIVGAAIVLADPVIGKILLAISATYLTYLALRIAFSGAKIALISMSKPV